MIREIKTEPSPVTLTGDTTILGSYYPLRESCLNWSTKQKFGQEWLKKSDTFKMTCDNCIGVYTSWGWLLLADVFQISDTNGMRIEKVLVKPSDLNTYQPS